MARRRARYLAIPCAVGVAAASVGLVAPASAHGGSPARHVLVLSIDGLHQSDLDWYVAHHPGSALARIVAGGADFTQARTPVPSDSFPGLVAQMTGGNPSSTGIYYDVTYNHAVFPPGTTSCSGPAPGGPVNFDETIDRNSSSIDAGQGLAGLPGSILTMTGHPQSLIDPAALPVDPSSCRPIYPHSYLRVNTVFEVARNAGMRTAWSDKHPAYEILNGPSGTGVQDLFTPEINSNAPTASSSIDWTKDNALTMQYDGYKVEAVLNEIAGYDHSGRHHVGAPAIFGMNFQTVSTAQKLPTSDGLAGGYLGDGVTPGPLLRRALAFVDGRVEAMLDAIHAHGLDGSTTLILSAKHGQSPMQPSALLRIDDGAIIDALNAAWAAHHPGAAPLVAGALDDDGMLLWLSNRSVAATRFARSFLLSYSGTGNNIDDQPVTFHRSGLTTVVAGTEAARYFDVQPGDPRVPDIFGITRYGVVYTGGTGKIAEHGGAHLEDRHVPLVVYGAGVGHHAVSATVVETTRIAPTILTLLGLDPRWLQAVRIEHTAALPLS